MPLWNNTCKTSRAKSVLVIAIAATFPLLQPVSRTQAAPDPSILPVSWELDFTSQSPERLVIYTDKGERQIYWYVRYKVINNTKEDQLFTPEFQLLTDTGQLVDSGKGVPAGVFEKIKKLYGNDLMESPIEVLGRLKQGPDNAKDSVAIFADVDKDSRKFRIIATGLFGETARSYQEIAKVTVTDAAPIKLDDKPCTLADLKSGMRIVATTTDGKTASAIQAYPLANSATKAAADAPSTIVGKISSVQGGQIAISQTIDLKNPLTGAPVVLRKALVLDYDVPGESIGIPPAPTLRAKSYVMK